MLCRQAWAIMALHPAISPVDLRNAVVVAFTHSARVSSIFCLGPPLLFFPSIFLVVTKCSISIPADETWPQAASSSSSSSSSSSIFLLLLISGCFLGWWLPVSNFLLLAPMITLSVLENTSMWIFSWNFHVVMPDTSHTSGYVFFLTFNAKILRKHGFCWHTPSVTSRWTVQCIKRPLQHKAPPTVWRAWQPPSKSTYQQNDNSWQSNGNSTIFSTRSIC